MWLYQERIIQAPANPSSLIPIRFISRKCPVQVDLSNSFTSLKSQGNIGSCVAFSLVSVFEYLMKKEGLLSNDDQLSERFLYYQTLLTVYECIPADLPGISVEDALRVASTYGVCSEAFFPYFKTPIQTVLHRVDMSQTPSDEAYSDAKKYRITGYGKIVSKNLAEQIRIALFLELPVIVVFQGGPGSITLQTQYYDGILHRPQSIEWSHCVVITGYDDDLQLFKFRNTWNGKFLEWGDRGYGYFRYNELDVITDAYTITGVRIRSKSTQIAIQRHLGQHQIVKTIG